MQEQFILLQLHTLPENLKAEVLRFILFLKSESENHVGTKKKQRVFGHSKERYKMVDDFDAPLDDFEDYL